MISVVVPIFNSEKYLDRCISSIVEQSFTDLEVILVDDGSTDRSTEICEKYVKQDKRIRYYRKKNGGGSSARNLGLSKATGAYVAFVDSDDYLGKEYFAKLAEKTINDRYVVIQCGMTLERGNTRVLLSHKEIECNREEYARMVISRQIPIFLFQTTVSKLYKRSVISENQLLFDEQISISEDCLFNTELMPYVGAYCYVDCNEYYYNQNNGDSLTHKRKRDYHNVSMGINVGIITSMIRNNCISANQLHNDSQVSKGFQKAISIIYLSNAHEIEEANLTEQQRKQLYVTYFSQMNYPIDQIIDEYSGTDKIILEASRKKDYNAIHGVYRLRHIKRKLLSFLPR